MGTPWAFVLVQQLCPLPRTSATLSHPQLIGGASQLAPTAAGCSSLLKAGHIAVLPAKLLSLLTLLITVQGLAGASGSQMSLRCPKLEPCAANSTKPHSTLCKEHTVTCCSAGQGKRPSALVLATTPALIEGCSRLSLQLPTSTCRMQQSLRRAPCCTSSRTSALS